MPEANGARRSRIGHEGYGRCRKISDDSMATLLQPPFKKGLKEIYLYVNSVSQRRTALIHANFSDQTSSSRLSGLQGFPQPSQPSEYHCDSTSWTCETICGMCMVCTPFVYDRLYNIRGLDRDARTTWYQNLAGGTGHNRRRG